MWNMKVYYMDLSTDITEEQMFEFFYELDKQDNNRIWYNEVCEIFN